MSVRPMLWHIYGPEHVPLCWDDKALEFETNMAAREFLASAMDNACWDDDFWVEAEIVMDILYYDGGYLDATHLRVGRNEITAEEILIPEFE